MSRIVRDYINSAFSINSVWVECFNEYAPRSKCFCPFHENYDSPAAKVYDDRLVCFGACQRSYFPYDFLKKFRPDLLKVHSSTVLPVQDRSDVPQPICRFGRHLTAEELLKRITGL